MVPVQASYTSIFFFFNNPSFHREAALIHDSYAPASSPYHRIHLLSPIPNMVHSKPLYIVLPRALKVLVGTTHDSGMYAKILRLN